MAGITEDLQREIDAWCSGSFIKTPPTYIATTSRVAVPLPDGIDVDFTSGQDASFLTYAPASKKIVPALDAYMRQQPLWTSNIDPRQEEIANLKGELEAARYDAANARKLAYAVKAERDAALYERNIALQSLVELIQHFINAPAPAPAEEDPAVRAVRVMQAQGVR